MKRPKSHVTDTLGEAQLRSIFEPLSWVVNVIARGDYGIDFDVQIFEEEKATGEWFKIQLKSSESTIYSTQGDFVSETLDKDHAAHYSTEIRDPMFLMHADVANRRTFWYAPQLNTPVTSDDPRENITVRIPTRSELPSTLSDLVSTLERVRIKLGIRSISESGVSEFSRSVPEDDREQADLIKEFQNRTDIIRLQNVRTLADLGKPEEANEKAENLIQSNETSIETKLSAVLAQERTDIMASYKSSAPQNVMSKIRLRTALRLHQLTRKGPPALKFFSLMTKKAAELEVLVFQDLGLHMNLLGHIEADNSSIMTVSLAVAYLQSTNRVVAKYNQCVRLARYAANSRHRWALPMALLRIVESISLFLIRLEKDGHANAVQQYKKSAMQLCDLAVWIAERNQDGESLSAASTTVLLLTHKKETESAKNQAMGLARQIATKIKDRQIRDLTEAAIDRSVRRLSGQKVEGDPDPNLVTQIIQNRAFGLGIDMSDSQNLLVKAIRLGIKDANPERIVKHCQHTFISLGGGTPGYILTLAELLQLPSMGSKIIHCDLHNHYVVSPTLDLGFKMFKEQYCDKCPDVTPRAASWEYSNKWLVEENAKHREFMEQFKKRNQR